MTDAFWIPVFWALIALAGATVFGYGAAALALASLGGDRPRRQPPPLKATLLIAAHNEEGCIADKIANTLGQDLGDHDLDVVVVSDGSDDRTAEVVRGFGDPRVRVVEIREHVGKIAALNRALEGIGGDVVIFSDANSEFVPGALKALLDGFGDPEVGGVCGALAIARKRSGWLGVAETAYWRYDNALKQAESRLAGAVSAQGSLYAVRRGLIGRIPLSVADDFYISTQVVEAGLRLAFEPAAVTVEPVSGNTRGEFFRRVRSTERGWRGLLMRRGLLNPFRTGGYAVQLLFHKALRRMTPFFLAALLVLSAALAGEHWIYAAALAGQAALYGLALLTLLVPAVRRVPGATLAYFFVETQAAMALGLIRVALGRHSRSWKPVRDAAAVGGK